MSIKQQCLDIIDPGDRPCDCIEKYNGVWIETCDCRNFGDLSQASTWCTLMNTWQRVQKEIQ